MTTVLAAGVPAYNEGPRLAEAVRSLQAQRLPPDARWGEIWIVLSGCSDSTPRVARELQEEDPRIRVVEQPERRGKAAALEEIFSRAQGDALVLLNGDARARSGAVDALVRAASAEQGPFALMGRPCLDPEREGPLDRGLGILWEIHHRMHEDRGSQRRSNHLSDELWLLPLPVPARIPEGTVNDGSYLGARLRARGGRIRYVPEAEVDVRVAWTPADHVRQRRRISWGHHQVHRMLGEEPSTWMTFLRNDPAGALRMLRDCLGGRPEAYAWFAFFGLLEAEAQGLAVWDRWSGRRDHVRWRPTATPDLPSRASPSSSPRLGAERDRA